MKLTRILPKRLAISWQEYDLRRTDGYLEYYEQLASVYKQASDEGHAELERLRGGN